MDQDVEHLADHAEVIAVALELALDVREVSGRRVEAACKQAGNKQRDLRIGL